MEWSESKDLVKERRSLELSKEKARMLWEITK